MLRWDQISALRRTRQFIRKHTQKEPKSSRWLPKQKGLLSQLNGCKKSHIDIPSLLSKEESSVGIGSTLNWLWTRKRWKERRERKGMSSPLGDRMHNKTIRGTERDCGRKWTGGIPTGVTTNYPERDWREWQGEERWIMGFITSVESLGIYLNDEGGITEEREESV